MLSSAGCVTAAVSVAEPTAIERQLLGAYDELDQDLIQVSSVRGQKPKASVSYYALKREAIAQRSIQRFNEDDLSELKQNGCVAESLSARVLARPCPEVASDPATARRRRRVLEEENRARRAVLQWAAYRAAWAEGRPAPSASEIDDLRTAYRKLLVESAKPGEWFETKPGNFEETSP